MRRIFVIAAAALALLGAAVAFSAPTIARYVAESEVDAALKRIRVQTTSVVTRGGVSFDLSSWSVTVRDLSIDGPGDASLIKIGALTIERPSKSGELLVAARVVVDDVTVKSAGETITVPRIDIEDYSGPERGLTATPGVGRNARSQADLIGRISLKRAVAPIILFSGDQTKIRRTVRNTVVLGVDKGVVQSATVAEITVAAPYISPEQTPSTSSLAIEAGPIVYESLSLPTLWRFYAGDGVGDREPFLKSGSIKGVRAVATLRPGGVVEAGASEIRVEGVKLRPLAYPVTTFDPIASRMRLGQPPTPQEVREQLLFAADGLRAISFHRIALEGAQFEFKPDGAPHRSGRLGLGEIGPYADGRIELIKAVDFAYQGDGVRLAARDGEAFQLDARGLTAFAERVGRDEQLMTTSPTAEEIVKFAPRLGRLEASGVDLVNGEGALTLATARIDVNAPLDAVPQRVAFKLDRLDAQPADGTWFKRFLALAQLDELRGSAAFALTLDPSARSLTLDRFDYDFEKLGVIKATGELSAVDPLLAVATGANLVDKVSAIELGTFKFTARDAGAVAVILERAAEAAGVLPEVYREQVARETQDTIFRLFGPQSENSAESAADFIRDPRSIEIIVSPRNASQPLLDLIRAFDLGPAGIAQVIAVGILYRR